MKHYQLTITSKNEKSAKNCFLFLSKNLAELNLNTIKKSFQKKKRKKVLTILKSPHVNKAAQEQFESRFFTKQLNLYSARNFQLLLFLKKVKIYLFPDINLKVKFILNKNLSEKIKTKIFNPSNFKLKIVEKIKIKKYESKKKAKSKGFSLHEKKILENIYYKLKVYDIYSELQKDAQV